MKLAVALLCLLFCCPAAYAAQDTPDRHTQPAKQHADDHVQTTEKGTFGLEMMVNGQELKNGPNTLDITVRDKDGKNVEGAELTVTPWMPAMGHGVWDKPVVTERGGGKYHVENVRIIMNGLWALKVAVRKGEQEDRAEFTFRVAEKEQQARKEPEKPRENYERTVQYYNIPNVTLLDQDGKRINLRTITESGKPVIVDFIFTTCTTICPVLSAGFSNLRTELGENANRVQLVSISIDPENDRPEQLKEYLSRFNSGEGWEFLTGSRDDIGRVLKAFDAFIVDKMSHEPLYILRGPNSEEWVRIKGLIKKADLMKELRKVENK
jgi:protein SCO1/2